MSQFTKLDAVIMQQRCDANRKRADFIAESNGDPVELESKLHDKIIAYCDSKWPRWKYIRARMDKKSTMQVGCHDFTIFARFNSFGTRVFLIECKARDEKPTSDQLIWHKEMQMLGFDVQVVRNYDEFLTSVNQ